MYYGPNITTDSLAGGTPIWEGLAISYMSLRIIICVIISTICAVQLYYEIKYQSRRTMINARFFTFIGVILYPIFRIFYTAFFFKDRDEDTATACDYTSLFSIFFQMWSWTWVGAYWCRLLLALFSVNIIYDKRVWKLAWFIIGIFFSYVLLYIIFSVTLSSSTASMFFTGGFLVLLVFFGTICVGCGLFLYRQIYHYKGTLLNDRVKAIIKRIRNLAIVMTCAIIITVIRDLVYYVILKIPLNSSLKHASNCITMTIEFILAACIMISVSEKPINYLKFKCANPSLVPKFIDEKEMNSWSNSHSASISQKTTTSSTSVSIGSSRLTSMGSSMSSSISSSSSTPLRVIDNTQPSTEINNIIINQAGENNNNNNP